MGLGFLLVRGVSLIEEPAGAFRWDAAIVPITVLAVTLGVVEARPVAEPGQPAPALAQA